MIRTQYVRRFSLVLYNLTRMTCLEWRQDGTREDSILPFDFIDKIRCWKKITGNNDELSWLIYTMFSITQASENNISHLLISNGFLHPLLCLYAKKKCYGTKLWINRYRDFRLISVDCCIYNVRNYFLTSLGFIYKAERIVRHNDCLKDERAFCSFHFKAPVCQTKCFYAISDLSVSSSALHSLEIVVFIVYENYWKIQTTF